MQQKALKIRCRYNAKGTAMEREKASYLSLSVVEYQVKSGS
jgi:hypothetical protein